MTKGNGYTMTVGDVNAIIAGVTITGATLWASIVGINALFPERTERATRSIREQPGRTFGVGFVSGLIAGALGIALLNSGNGLLQLFGWVALLALGVLATIGSAGIASLLADKVTPLDTRLSRLGSIGRAAAFMVASGFVPFIGWLGFFPMLFLMSLGAGFRALTEKKLYSQPAQGTDSVVDSVV
jgi:MFS family permease